MTDYPDFTVIARLKGEYDGAEKSVVLDAEGALQALLYGTYDAANKKILVDEDGNVRMNLYAQDLDEMVNRFKYGAPTFSYASSGMPIQGWNTIYDITGKGYIYHFDAYLKGAASHYLDQIEVTMDGELFTSHNFNTLNIYNSFKDDSKALQLAIYNDVEFEYRVVGLQGYTFESSILIRYSRNPVNNPNVLRSLVYTLI